MTIELVDAAIGAAGSGVVAALAGHAAQLREVSAAVDEARDHLHQVSSRSLGSPVNLARAALHRAAIALAAQQPRDLSGRIRGLSTRWFNAWASLGTMDHQTDAALRMCLDVLRQADRSARGCPEQMTCHELVNVLREWATNAHESTRPVFAKVADELEAIVRDGEKR